MAIGCGHTRQCHARHSNHGLRRSSERIQGVFPIEIAFNSAVYRTNASLSQFASVLDTLLNPKICRDTSNL